MAQSDPDFIIPPDTHGAVGLDKVMSTHNSNYVIQDKATGAVLSSVSMNSFWAASGATGLFDPKVAYDPYAQRWLLTAASNMRSASSSICVAISQTSDPSGSYYIVRDPVGTATLWGHFLSLGFNKHWVAIAFKMNFISPDVFAEARLFILDYSLLRLGIYSRDLYTGVGTVLQPCITYSTTQDTLFLVQHISGAGATYQLSTVTMTSAAPALSLGTPRVNPLGPWVEPGGEILPQAPESPPGAGTRKIDSGDSRVMNAVYRNGGIYFAQTIGLPAGGPLTHTAVQWVKLAPDGSFLQGGRVNDPTATESNGGKWYAYPSLSVNKDDAVLLGFSQFASDQSPSAGYAFRAGNDPAGTMQDPLVFKSGEGYYEKTYGDPRNRWGDYSNTQVDPSNDVDLWTIQEYSQAPVGNGNGSGRWGTWWAKVTPVPLPVQLAWFRGSVVNGREVVLTWGTVSEQNNYGFEIERASDGPYRTIPGVFIPGHGTTLEPQSYSFREIPATRGILYYRLKQIDLDGTVHHSEGIRVDGLTAVAGSPVPAELVLEQNYPNPFNPLTTVRYAVPKKQHVTLTVFNPLGQHVAVLVDGERDGGYHQVRFDGSRLSSGVYFYRLRARQTDGGIGSEFSEVRKMVLMR